MSANKTKVFYRIVRLLGDVNAIRRRKGGKRILWRVADKRYLGNEKADH